MNPDTTPQEETIEAYKEAYETEKNIHKHTTQSLNEARYENYQLKKEIDELKYYISGNWKAKGWKQEI